MQTRKKGYQLYDPNPKGKPKIQAGYKNTISAKKTLKQLRGKPRDYQQQVAITMFYRAKHHKYQTKAMRNAMKVYSEFLKKL